MDKRDFDLEIEEQNIYTEIKQLYKAIEAVKKDSPTQQEKQIISTRIQEIKQKYSINFDALDKQEDILNQEFMGIQILLKQDERKEQVNQIKEMDEYEEEMAELNNLMDIDEYAMENAIDNPSLRIEKLKKQIDEIHKKLLQLNNGKGKWFDTDHKDFIKIYNRCAGNDKKIISEGIKILGMNQTQIMDHLQLYENYLQLEKEKKIVSEEYRQIKLLQSQQNRQAEQQQQQIKKLEQKLKKEKEMQQRLRKKQEISLYRQKKHLEKQRMIQKQEEEKQKILRVPPLQQSKKKNILERNKLFIENQQKKLSEARNKKQSLDNKRQQSTEARKQQPAPEISSRIPNNTKKLPPKPDNLTKKQ